MLVGGGERPAAALARFSEWAGKDRAHILVITWATSEPEVAFKSLAKDFAPYTPAEIVASPDAPLNPAKRAQFLLQLKSATGVFFSGGDQVRIMQVVSTESLGEPLRARYREGVVFGGTSAGTAIMSRKMITGEGDLKVINGAAVQTSEGLGLLPDRVIVDQHFIKRQRENRLFGLILETPDFIGIGIDESTALLLSGNTEGEIAGASQVMLVSAQKTGDVLVLRLLKTGDRFQLTNGRPQ